MKLTENPTTYKSIREGWTTESQHDLQQSSEDGAMHLRLLTMKRSSGQLATTAQVVFVKPDGTFSFMVFQDYRRTVVSGVMKRVNAEACIQQHNMALEQLAELRGEIAKHYEKLAA